MISSRHPASRPRIVPCAALLLVATISVLLTGSTAPAGETYSRAPQVPERAFGYYIGEERRYVLEPPGSLVDGEGRDWRIKLESIEGEGEDYVSTFSLEYEERGPAISARGPQEAYFRVEGELRVNRYGFPVALRYVEFEAQAGESPWRGESRTTAYEYDPENRRFNKSVRVPDQELDYTVPVARGNELDLSLPSGLFAYLPTGEGDEALFNPGLLSLALPSRIDAALPDTKVIWLSPQITPRFPDRNWITAERNGREALSRNYSPSEIRLVERTSVELGNRTVPAWRLEVRRFPAGVYVDDGGQVLRVDINRHPRTNGERWIRLLHPTEY